MSAQGRLDRRRVVVTGAARGLGRAVATRLVGEGAAAMLADVDAGGLDKTVRSLTRPVLSLVADCATAEGVTRVLDDATAAWGSPPDALVNNAGVLANGLLLDLADADIDRVLRINAMGPMLATREFARRSSRPAGPERSSTSPRPPRTSRACRVCPPMPRRRARCSRSPGQRRRTSPSTGSG